MKIKILALSFLMCVVSCSVKPSVGLLMTGSEAQLAEVGELAQMLGEKAEVTVVCPEDFAGKAGQFDVVWFHRPDTAAATEAEIALKDDVVKYVADGGKLVLSMDAVKLLNTWGIEDEPVQTWTYNCVDYGYGRKLGYHAYRYHPLFENMNAGAYPWHGKENNTCRINGFDGQALPQAEGAKVIATQWEYIYNRPNKKVIWETPVGEGLILSIGSCLYYGRENFHEALLRQFTGNCVAYLTADGFETEPKYWDYTPAEVKPFHEGHGTGCRICASEFRAVHPSAPEKWAFPETDMILSREATSNYFDVSAPNTMLVAFERGGIDEIWTHPFMSMRDYRVWLDIEGEKELVELSSFVPQFEITPFAAVRHYDVNGIRLDEIITTAVDKPASVAHYEWEGEGLRSILVEFKSNLRYMWPYSETALGSLNYGWSVELNGMVVRDNNSEFVSIVGSNVPGTLVQAGQYDGFNFGGRQVVSRPTNALQVAAVTKYEVKGINAMDMIMVAGAEGQDAVLVNYASVMRTPKAVLDGAAEYYRNYLAGVIEVNTPDAEFNEAFKWAQVSSAQFIVETPGLGRSLMAGYASSRRGWGGGHRVSGRPGYAWYFGRDSEWAAYAFADMGDFATVRDVLTMLKNHQQSDGKMYHELTSSGFVHYDASDATPLYVCLMAHYLRNSGDVKYVKENMAAIDLAMDYCKSTDTDGDGLIEISNVGHGWLEGGTLFGSQTEFYLCGIWKAALEEAAYIHGICGSSAKAKEYAKMAEDITPALEAFWNEEKEHYNYALTKEDTYGEDFLVLAAVPVYFEVVDGERSAIMSGKYSDPMMSADWGARTVSKDSKQVEGGAYGYTNVWPLFTGWKALAEYRTGHYNQGFATFVGSIKTYKSFSLGRVPEVINGEIHRNNGITQHQCWSETMTIMPFVEGLLGFRPDALEAEAELAPAVPAGWDTFEVKRLKVGAVKLDCSMERTADKTVWTLAGTGRLGLEFSPVLPLGTEVKSVSVNGVPVDFEVEALTQGVSVSVDLVLNGNASVEICHEGGLEIVPIVNPYVYDAPNTGYRIVGQKMEDGVLCVELTSAPENVRTLRFYAPDGYGEVCGIENVSEISDGLYEGTVAFGKPEEGIYTHKTIHISSK